jgi:hypothetical protein
MGTIIPFLKDSVFDQNDIIAMSMALDGVCEVMRLQDDSQAREIMAARIIDLARCGERSPTRLRDTVLHEAGLAEYAGSVTKAHRKHAPRPAPCTGNRESKRAPASETIGAQLPTALGQE